MTDKSTQLTTYQRAREHQKRVEDMHKDAQRHCEQLLKTQPPTWLADLMSTIDEQ